jgi:colanic acid/amylovoran biosynthesis glycosyltransferase
MPRGSAAGELCVAHLRHLWFLPTETFLYNTIRHCRETRPVLIGYERVNAAEFPISCPVVPLYQPGTWAAKWQRIRFEVLGERGRSHFENRRVDTALQRHGARVLHAHFGSTGARSLGVRHRTGLPLITTFYGRDVSADVDLPEWRERYPRLFEEGERFLVEGPHMRQRLIEAGCPPEKAHVQRIAIEVERYPFRRRPPKPPAEPVRIFFCASFREKKGLSFALEAVARVRDEFPRIEFRVGGDGELRGEVEDALDRLGLRSHTRLLGFLRHREMVDEMDRADLFLQPSVTASDGDSEGGAPTTILEAQACGLPVLATEHADIPNVVAPGRSALLAPERDVDALASHLASLLKEQDRWAAMGEAGREQVTRFHAVGTEMRRLEAHYFELAGERPAGC